MSDQHRDNTARLAPGGASTSHHNPAKSFGGSNSGITQIPGSMAAAGATPLPFVGGLNPRHAVPDAAGALSVATVLRPQSTTLSAGA